MNKDPLGEAGGLNPYAAMSNNPVNYVDPIGLSDTMFGGVNLICVGYYYGGSGWGSDISLGTGSDQIGLGIIGGWGGGFSSGGGSSGGSNVIHASAPPNMQDYSKGEAGLGMQDFSAGLSRTVSVVGIASFINEARHLDSPPGAALASVGMLADKVSFLGTYMGKHGEKIGLVADGISFGAGLASATAIAGGAASFTGISLIGTSYGFGWGMGTALYSTGYFDALYAVDYYRNMWPINHR
jgi:hypothetical protein